MATNRRTRRATEPRGVDVRLDLLDPTSHRIGVELKFVAPTDRPEVAFATWTPGSYLIREFARQVEDFEASDVRGRKLGSRKVAKNSWGVDAVKGEVVVVRFRIFARELSVRTPWLDADRGFVVPAGVIPFVRGLDQEPHRVALDLPDGWRADVALPQSRGSFVASDFDHLVDSPIEAGTHRRIDFRTGGVPHRVTIAGQGNQDDRRLAADFERIVAESARLFGGLPYERYLLIVHLTAANRGGLEHRDSSVCDFLRFGFRPEKEYEEFLGLVAHEFFHTWNVKRIKPAAFCPYDFERECYTRLLWAMEGATSYYEWRILRGAGLLSVERYLARLADKINRLEATPGRKRKPVAEASFDAWIKHYRPDEHSPNSTVSYYEKGELVALLLDLEIRRMTGGERSYDDLMRLLWREHGKTGVGIPEDGYRPAAEEIAGGSLRTFWNRYVDGTAEIDWERSLEPFGLAVHWKSEPEKGWLGVRTKSDGGRLVLENVFDGTPAAKAGLTAGDELVAISGAKVEPDSFGRRIEDLGPRGRGRLALFRAGMLMELPFVLSPKPRQISRIAFATDAPAAARKLGGAWLGVGDDVHSSGGRGSAARRASASKAAMARV